MMKHSFHSPYYFPLKKLQESPRIPMAKTTKILRRSIYTFLQNYQYFTTTAALLAIPFSASILLSQALLLVPSSSSLLLLHNRLNSLFHAAGFPPSSEFFNLLSLKLSQTISSSIFTLPFALTFLLLAKASIIQSLKQQQQQHKPNSPPSIFNPLFFTYICNSLLILSANATVFSLLFIAFNFLEGSSGFSFLPNSTLLLSVAAAVLYSVVLANVIIITNMALVISGMESCGGYLAILKACVRIRGRTSVALSLALPAHLVFAGIEALFHFRIVRAYRIGGGMTSPSMTSEGILITYLYSISVVLDTVISCMFYKSCMFDSWIEQEDVGISLYSYQIKMAEEEEEEDKEGYVSLKNCEEIA